MTDGGLKQLLEVRQSSEGTHCRYVTKHQLLVSEKTMYPCIASEKLKGRGEGEGRGRGGDRGRGREKSKRETNRRE